MAAYRAADTSPVLRGFLKLMWQMLGSDGARAKEPIHEPIAHAGG
jgi:hypothetical protein